MNSEMTPRSIAMSPASQGWKRQASTSPQPTPMGVIVSSSGLAILMARDCAALPSENVPRQIFILGEGAERAIHVRRVDLDGAAAFLGRIERHRLEQALHHGMQA